MNVKKLVVGMLVLTLVLAIMPLGTQAVSKKLVIHAPSSVNEGTNFIVYVTAEGGNQTISGVKITWLGQIYYTNNTVTLFAPFVNHTRVEVIYADKPGYESAKKEITILDVPEQPRLLISAPSAVYGGDGFSIFVTDSHYLPIAGAKVTFYVHLGGGGGNQSGNETDYIEIHYTINGSAWFTAPYVEEQTFGSFSAEKSGYLPASASILIMERLNQLVIRAPSSVLEGQTFSIFVTDSHGVPIDGAFVMFEVIGQGHNYSYWSYSHNGVAVLIAPLVDQTIVGWISASKPGYLSAQVPITIQNIAPELQLKIDAPSQVQEGSIFKVVVSANGVPIMNATVLFMNQSFSTNGKGIVVLTAPLVDRDMVVSIDTYKEGYLPGEAWITILNIK